MLEQFGCLLSHPPFYQRSCHSPKNSWLSRQSHCTAQEPPSQKSNAHIALITVIGSSEKSYMCFSSDFFPYSTVFFFLHPMVKEEKLTLCQYLSTNKMCDPACSIHFFQKKRIWGRWGQPPIFHQECIILLLSAVFVRIIPPGMTQVPLGAPNPSPKFLPTYSLGITISVCIYF